MMGHRHEAVEGLYAAFGHVRRPARVPGCPHCVAPQEDRPLLDGPVRSLPADALARYAAKAISTWGGAEEFRYFLPRLLECAAADAFGYPDPAIVFGKVAAAGWHAWPAGERAAIEAFLTAWWADTLERHPADPDAGTVLCCLGAARADLTPFLDHWGGLPDAGAVRHLREFVLYGVEWTRGPRLADAFWDRGSVAHRQVLTWLTDGGAATAVEAAFDAETREDVLGLLEELHAVLAAYS
ncbi:hypothetical protein GCM10027176_15340 [Actinoallomurus bryophytorum]|uniref:Uncharacterized protein n=1 Tax=Actinoallomurus bryophytorum TaxID=1490222 RepID=A0A543CNL2_9ACTN|nr:hypothetical protein [Actinoallomurus bryophytorum]TQL98692.1 hypothetical protein FB559_4320 [Actinoallomurus bryophytorum]